MTEKALADVTILDFSHLLQGPFCTQLLADLGANVIKVERPGQGDLFRTMTFNNRWVGGSESPNFLAWNRNKRSLALDLKAPDARTILYRIGARADVVVQNFRPGVLAKLGYAMRIFASSIRASSTAPARATAKAVPMSAAPARTCSSRA